MFFPFLCIFWCFHIIFIIFPTDIKCKPCKALTSWQVLTPRSKHSSTFSFWCTWPRWQRGAWLPVPACSRKASHFQIRSRKHWRRRTIDLNSCIIDLFFIVSRFRLWVIWGSSSKKCLLFFNNFRSNDVHHFPKKNFDDWWDFILGMVSFSKAMNYN